MRITSATFAMLALGSVACGASEPREEDIFHQAALRPTFLEPTSDAERQLLSALQENPAEGSLDVAGVSYLLGETYDAASGRRCRSVAQDRDRKLACESDDGWRFVPGLDDGS